MVKLAARGTIASTPTCRTWTPSGCRTGMATASRTWLHRLIDPSIPPRVATASGRDGQLTQARCMRSLGLKQSRVPSALRFVAALSVGCPVILASTGSRVRPIESTVYVSVADARGQPVTSLSAADFDVRVDNEDRPVIAAPKVTESVALVVVPATSGRYVLPIRDTLGVIEGALGREPAGYREGITLKNVAAVTFRGPADGKGALVRDFNRGFTDGSLLLDGILEATHALAQEGTARRVVLVLLWYSVGNQLPPEVDEALRQAHTALWGVELASPPTGDRLLTTSAQWSGGRVDTIQNPGIISDSTRQLMGLLTSEYAVRYKLLDPAPRGGHLRVGVRREGVTVAAPAWVD